MEPRMPPPSPCKNESYEQILGYRRYTHTPLLEGRGSLSVIRLRCRYAIHAHFWRLTLRLQRCKIR